MRLNLAIDRRRDSPKVSFNPANIPRTNSVPPFSSFPFLGCDTLSLNLRLPRPPLVTTGLSLSCPNCCSLSQCHREGEGDGDRFKSLVSTEPLREVHFGDQSDWEWDLNSIRHELFISLVMTPREDISHLLGPILGHCERATRKVLEFDRHERPSTHFFGHICRFAI